jgi:hypothetical protein
MGAGRQGSIDALPFLVEGGNVGCGALNLVQVQKWSCALEETPDFELDLV